MNRIINHTTQTVYQGNGTKSDHFTQHDLDAAGKADGWEGNLVATATQDPYSGDYSAFSYDAGKGQASIRLIPGPPVTFPATELDDLIDTLTAMKTIRDGGTL